MIESLYCIRKLTGKVIWLCLNAVPVFLWVQMWHTGFNFIKNREEVLIARGWDHPTRMLSDLKHDLQLIDWKGSLILGTMWVQLETFVFINHLCKFLQLIDINCIFFKDKFRYKTYSRKEIWACLTLKCQFF